MAKPKPTKRSVKTIAAEHAKRKKSEAPITDNTVPRRDKRETLKPFKPGESGNPAGRPKGSRNKLEEAFLRDLHAAWGELGIAAIKAVAQDDPASFLRVIAGLMPKQQQVSGEGGGPLKLQLISGDAAL